MVKIGDKFGNRLAAGKGLNQKGRNKFEKLGLNEEDFVGKTPEEIRAAAREANRQKDNVNIDDPLEAGESNVGQEAGVADPIRQAGKQATSAGQGLTNDSTGFLGGLLGNTKAESESAFGRGLDSRGLSLDAQRIAENPDFNQNTQTLFNDRAAQRTGEVDALFGKGGREQELLGKNLANNIADLDELGVSGTSESSAIGGLLGDFQGRRAAATQQANELSRNEQLGERQDIRSTGLNLAGLRSGESLGESNLGAGLLGQGASGSLGAAGVGVDLQKLGLAGQDAALTQEGADREREFGISQAERTQRLNEEQNFLDNYLRNKGIAKGSDLEKQLMGLLGLE